MPTEPHNLKQIQAISFPCFSSPPQFIFFWASPAITYLGWTCHHSVLHITPHQAPWKPTVPNRHTNFLSFQAIFQFHVGLKRMKLIYVALCRSYCWQTKQKLGAHLCHWDQGHCCPGTSPPWEFGRGDRGTHEEWEYWGFYGASLCLSQNPGKRSAHFWLLQQALIPSASPFWGCSSPRITPISYWIPQARTPLSRRAHPLSPAASIPPCRHHLEAWAGGGPTLPPTGSRGSGHTGGGELVVAGSAGSCFLQKSW